MSYTLLEKVFWKSYLEQRND